MKSNSIIVIKIFIFLALWGTSLAISLKEPIAFWFNQEVVSLSIDYSIKTDNTQDKQMVVGKEDEV